MSTDQIIGQFRNKGFNSGFDLVMLKSLYSINQLSRQQFLHPIDQYLDENDLKNKFNSEKYNFVGIGLKPFVFAYHADSMLTLRTYSDLRNNQFYTALDDSEIVPLFASLMPKLKRAGTYSWIRDFYKQKRTYTPSRDTLGNMLCLTTTSVHNEMVRDPAYKSRFNSLYIPNQHGDGAFYDMNTAAVVYQAEHFSLANQFIHFYLENRHNAILNEKLGNIALRDTEKIRIYRIAPEKLIQYYTTIDRIINKLR